jgi:hypothetical protein
MKFAKTDEDLALAVGVSRRTISTWKRSSSFPKRSVRGWHIGSVERWRGERFSQGDPLLAGGTSPALERYRIVRTKREELNLSRELGEVRSLAEIQGVWQPFTAALRQACERIQRLNLAGAEAVEAIRESVDAGERALEAAGLSEGDGGQATP